MRRFSPESLRRLRTCDERLQRLFLKVVEIIDCTVITGHRTRPEQEEAFRTGKSKLNWPNSLHNSNPSRAIDIAPSPIDWNDLKRFYYFAGIVKGVAALQGIEIRFGGDWDGDNDFKDQTFNDLVHFELKGPK